MAAQDEYQYTCTSDCRARLIRIETRLAKLMLHLGMNVDGSVPSLLISPSQKAQPADNGNTKESTK